MTFHQLRDYIGKKMRMQHIYQPVMLMTLLRRKGKATRRQIAKEILTRDESQTDYYEQMVQNMVGDVLTKRRGITERDGQVGGRIQHRLELRRGGGADGVPRACAFDSTAEG